MEARVWTSWGSSGIADKGKPKCIFEGEISVVPRIGEWVVVKEGFCAEQVTEVIHDFTDDTVEISVSTSDDDNEYGD